MDGLRLLYGGIGKYLNYQSALWVPTPAAPNGTLLGWQKLLGYSARRVTVPPTNSLQYKNISE